MMACTSLPRIRFWLSVYLRNRPAATGLKCFSRRKHDSTATLVDHNDVAPLRRYSNFVDKLKFIETHDEHNIPVYRVMNRNGEITNKKNEPSLDRDTIEEIYRQMILINTMDNVLNDLQSQGKVSFYLTNYGEEATQFGTAAALNPDDLVYGQYRDCGVFLWRGFTMNDFVNQCFSNKLSTCKGRQLPTQFGSKKCNFVTLSSPLATQIAQAPGAAHVLKRSGKDLCVACYFGEGAASEGDAQAGFNFAATLEVPVLFICRNNGYAISTPTSEQYRGDGIAARSRASGIRSIRVDGNDVFAVYNATKAAREYVVRESKPVLIEAMTYRVGEHSTNVDSAGYRTKEEVDYWVNQENPIVRLRSYMVSINWWGNEQEENLKRDARSQVLQAVKQADKTLNSNMKDFFTDVYDVMPRHLAEQYDEFAAHIRKYPTVYPIDNFSKR